MSIASKLHKIPFLKKVINRNLESRAGPPAAGYFHVEREPSSHNHDGVCDNTTIQTLRQQLQERQAELARATEQIRQVEGRFTELVQEMNRQTDDMVQTLGRIQEVESALSMATDQMEGFKQHQTAIEEYFGRNIVRALNAPPMSPQPNRPMTSGPVPRVDRRSCREYKDPEVGFEWVDLDGDESLLVCALYRPKRT